MSEILKCPKHGNHFDTRWGCPLCPRGEEKLKMQLAEALQWKEHWFKQREATGKMAWEVPPVSYLRDKESQ